MATNGAQEAFAPPDVLAAVMTMRSGEQEAKKHAHEYLERFQKSVGHNETHAVPPAC
jgi:transportin-3